MIELAFLGTSASIPTKDRGMFSVHLKHLDNRFLFDCGEGTQRQLFKAGISPFKIQNIFITHLHADHVLGIAGLIQTLNFLGRNEDLHIYGPVKIEKYVDFFSQWDYLELNYKIITHEVKEGIVFENDTCIVTAFEQQHSCPCFGYVFEEKTEINVDKKLFKKFGLKEGPQIKELKENGFVMVDGKKVTMEQVSLPKKKPAKITFSVDTRPHDGILKYAMNSDVLVSEATHSEGMSKKSHEYGHMTAKDAATIAKQTKSKKLVISHFSNRYEDIKELEDEAKAVFKNTIAAEDLMTLEVED